MVDATGEIWTLSREKSGQDFYGAVVALGALGVVTKVTLNVQPSYRIQQYVYENQPLSQLKDHFDAIESAAYSVSLFTDWQNGKINEVWLKCRIDQKPLFDAPAEFFGARKATRNLHPIADLSAENCTEQLGVPGPWYERLPHFKMGFTPSAGKELQSEYFVPRHHAMEAILAVERLHDQIGTTSPDHGNSRNRRRRTLDESLLQAGQRDHSFHVETGLACSKQIASHHRKRVGSFSAPPSLGKTLHLNPSGVAFGIREASAVHSPESQI